MSDKPISPLRQRMIDDMTARRFTEDTQRDYLRHVRNFTAFLGCSSDAATSEDLRRYQLHLAKQEIGPGSINAAGTALRLFFKVTLERPDLVRHLAPVQRPRKAPVVLSEEEAARLLESAPPRRGRRARVDGPTSGWPGSGQETARPAAALPATIRATARAVAAKASRNELAAPCPARPEASCARSQCRTP